MLIKEYRKNKGLTQEALALQTGINYRSLQDYEQGHKKLSSENGDTLLRLSTALGCSIEELLMEEVMDTSAAPQHIENSIPSSFIHNQIIHCPKNKISGRWICTNQGITVLFYYNGTKQSYYWIIQKRYQRKNELLNNFYKHIKSHMIMHFCIIIWLFFHHQRSSSSKSNKLICPANGSLMITSTSSTISVFSISMDFFSSILITEDVF